MTETEQSETVMGHRIWRWTADDGLLGMVKPWKTSFQRAVCATGRLPSHAAPHGWEGLLCYCGINAFKLTECFDPQDLIWAVGLDDPHDGQFSDALPAIGIIELGGIVDEYERGYRAEYGQIQELTVLTALPVDVSSLEEQYGVPVRTMAYEDWRKEWEATYGRDRKTSETDSDTQARTSPTSAITGTGKAARTAALNARAAAYTNTPSFFTTPTTTSPSLTPPLSLASAQRLLDNLKADRTRYDGLPRWQKIRERVRTSLRLDWRLWIAALCIPTALFHFYQNLDMAGTLWLFNAGAFGLSQWFTYK